MRRRALKKLQMKWTVRFRETNAYFFFMFFKQKHYLIVQPECPKCLFPKGECLSTHRVGVLGQSGSHFLGLLVLDFFTPTNLGLYLVGGWGVLPLKFFRCLKLRSFFFFFFEMCLAIRGNDFNFFFSANEPKIELVQRKWTQKSTLLANLTPVIWPFWGSKKSFSGLFRSFFRLVWEVFRHCFCLYKAYFWVYFQL